MNPNFTAWENPNIKIKSNDRKLTEIQEISSRNLYKHCLQRPWASPLKTLKFIRSTSKVPGYKLMTLYNKKRKKKRHWGKNTEASKLSTWGLSIVVFWTGWESGVCFLEPYLKASALLLENILSILSMGALRLAMTDAMLLFQKILMSTAPLPCGWLNAVFYWQDADHNSSQGKGFFFVCF